MCCTWVSENPQPPAEYHAHPHNYLLHSLSSHRSLLPLFLSGKQTPMRSPVLLAPDADFSCSAAVESLCGTWRPAPIHPVLRLRFSGQAGQFLGIGRSLTDVRGQSVGLLFCFEHVFRKNHYCQVIPCFCACPASHLGLFMMCFAGVSLLVYAARIDMIVGPPPPSTPRHKKYPTKGPTAPSRESPQYSPRLGCTASSQPSVNGQPLCSGPHDGSSLHLPFHRAGDIRVLSLPTGHVREKATLCQGC